MAVDTFALLVRSHARNSQILGMFLTSLAGFLFTVSFSCLQLFYRRDGDDISPTKAVLFRYGSQLAVTASVMLHNRIHPFGRSYASTGLLLMMGATNVLDIAFEYAAFSRIPLADFTAINLIRPILTFLFSFLITREHCTWKETLTGMVGCLGVVVICRPTFIFGSAARLANTHGTNGTISAAAINTFSEVGTSKYIEGIFLSLSSAVMTSLFAVLVKSLGRKNDVILSVFYPSAIGSFATPFVMLINSHRFSFNLSIDAWILLAWTSLLSYFGTMFSSEALQLENATHCMLMRNLDIVYAIVLQFLLMGLLPSWTTLIGALVIVISTGTLAWQRMQYENQNSNS